MMDRMETGQRGRRRRRTMRKLIRQTLWGTTVAAIALIAGHTLTSRPQSVHAELQERGAPAEALVSHTQVLADGTQQLCVLDPRHRVMAVYHVEPANGGISLRSVRNIYWDLRINHFNGTTPLPEEIRSLIEQE